MLTLDEGIICLTRGDTAYIDIKIPNELNDGDTVTFSVKKNIEDEDYVIQKTVYAGDTIVLQPEDTKDLEFGRYVYDVQLNTILGEIFTIIDPHGFKITKEVTV